MQTIHVLMNQRELDQQRLPGKVAVVFDVLLATTTITMALHHGANAVVTVPEIEDAHSYAVAGTILAGEKDAIIPDGFETFSPSGLAQLSLQGQRLVLVSTNGTVALNHAQHAAHTYAAALVNTSAMASYLNAAHNNETILLICSGSHHRFNIEDFLGAGLLAEKMISAAPDRFQLTDAARLAVDAAKNSDINKALHNSRVGHFLTRKNMVDDINLSASVDLYQVVPKRVDGQIIAVS